MAFSVGKPLIRMIAGPVVISVAFTALRLTGELLGWSGDWFSKATGGIVPSGWTWLVGITWLPVLFGPWFARALQRAGEEAPPGLKVLGLALAGAALALVGLRTLVPVVSQHFPHFLIVVWAVAAAAAALQVLGWPALFRVLLAYGLASRLVVVLVMFLAMWGDWGTHYDYVGMPAQFQMPLVPRFLWLAFFPQLVFWTAFTVLLGSLSAGVYLVVSRLAVGGRTSGA
jgi:hypothetical protein